VALELEIPREFRGGKLPDKLAFQLLEEYSIPLAPYGFAEDPEEAVRVARRIGYPVVLKISSPDISHKTDVGGVVLDLKSDEEVYRAAVEMLNTIRARVPSARIEGFLVQKMMPRGVEVIIGAKTDIVFGGVVLFGMGGLFTELYRDVTMRIAPVSFEEALVMIEEIKASPILRGYRNQPPVNMKSLAEVIVKASRIIAENPWIETMDLNPTIAYPDRAVVVDARIIARRRDVKV